ncbi:MAG TPA: ABC-ATPase domain-containing protein [Kiritimatiellia bacterium]|nr:ABC-ATPase domain-containing protein [Kiritimatiellia bacterium]HSA19084.1 ABC-ATPase domain-containing protein [Kiritimatiellia bacterium]
MRDKEEFYGLLMEIEGKEYREYAKLIGDFDFTRYVLKINQIQDAAAGQSTLVLTRVPQVIAGFPAHLMNTPVRRTALEDFLVRKLSARLESLARYDKEGISRRRIPLYAPGQAILPRTSLVVTDEYIEARLYVDLPSRHGCVAADSAREIFFEDLPGVVNASLIFCNLNQREVEDFVNLMEDADQVRQVLPTRGWVGFVGEGALLARAGDTDMPDYEQMTPLAIDDPLAVEVDVPNAGRVRGFGIPAGITVILGDRYSGRVDLVRALAAGIYNHVPGDGREWVVSLPDTVQIVAEAGRSVQQVDVSAFLREHPVCASVKQFTCASADACAAQIAGTVEAIEAGARVLLFEESASAAEFLAGGSASSLLPAAKRQVIPLAWRARQMVDELGVSIIVAGAAAVAEFLPVADTVLLVEGFKVSNVTQQARDLAIPAPPAPGSAAEVAAMAEPVRNIVPISIDPSQERYDAVISAPDIRTLVFGRSVVDLSGLPQLADVYQARTIGRILYYAKLRYLDEPRPVREILDLVDRDLSTEGLESLTRDLRGDLARPRRFEVAAALNRLETLRVTRSAG